MARSEAPELGPDEWWAEDLEGCAVRDASGGVGTVRRLLALPSCEVLEVRAPTAARDLLVPLVSDAVRAVDVEQRTIEIDLAVPGRGVMEIDVFTLFPDAFAWFEAQRHVANALAGGTAGLRQLPRPHAAERRAGRRHAVRRRRRDGAAGRRGGGGAARPLRSRSGRAAARAGG